MHMAWDGAEGLLSLHWAVSKNAVETPEKLSKIMNIKAKGI